MEASFSHLGTLFCVREEQLHVTQCYSLCLVALDQVTGIFQLNKDQFTRELVKCLIKLDYGAILNLNRLAINRVAAIL